MAGGAPGVEGWAVPVEMAIWRMTPEGPVPVGFSALASEHRLEDMIVADPSLLGAELLIVGRQVMTEHGGYADVVAVNSDGHIHVLELKRDRTPRDVVAQALDYGSWLQGLSLDQVIAIYAAQHDGDFEEAFAERFGVPVPDVFNADQQLTVVASALDPASDRIITYLAGRYGVPINAVFFRYFADGSSDFLARTWLISPDHVEARKSSGIASGKVRPWNGRDFYCVLGRVTDGFERWDVGLRYGFVGAGGGSWYWKPLRNLNPGHRVFAYVGGAGYVGVGEVVGQMGPLRDLVVHWTVRQSKLLISQTSRRGSLIGHGCSTRRSASSRFRYAGWRTAKSPKRYRSGDSSPRNSRRASCGTSGPSRS